jgi:hypothetical protein
MDAHHDTAVLKIVLAIERESSNTGGNIVAEQWTLPKSISGALPTNQPK